jgi:hypothetical protein
MFMRLPTLLACLSISASLFVACRSDDNNTPTDGQGSGSGSGNFVKIQQVQDDTMAPGTAVNLHDVVVTAIDNFGAKVGDIWVEEKEGGKRSGVHVFKAALSDVAMLTVGDEIDVKGAIKSEFALTGSNADPSGRTVTELEPASGGMITITKLGSSTTITPDKVDALAIGQMYDSTMAATGGGTAFTNAWEDWEGVLIETDNVAAQGAPKAFGSTSPTPADNYSFGITGVAKVEGSLADITMSSIARTTCFGTMTGVVDYFYDYLVLPRSTADFATTGGTCPQAESLCGDSIDNDGNGFTDCADNGCIINATSCRMATTIAAIDAAGDANPASPTLPSGGISIANACVTAVNGSDVYVAANALGAADGGLYVFGGGATLPTGVAAGTTVDVIGTVSAFKAKASTAPEGLIELAQLQITKDAAPCTPAPAVTGLTAAQMTADATGHKFIGSLVTLTGAGPTGQFKVTTAPVSHFGKLTQNATVFSFGTALDSALDAATTTTCYTSITGIWTYDTFGAGSYEILPTAVTSATCQ